MTPEEVFRAGPEYRQNLLKTTWPELHAALSPAPEDDGAPSRRVTCVLGPCPFLPVAERPEAVGRLTLNGSPACAKHIRASQVPGGYPLKRAPDRRRTS
jgi:hypothetical protein